jgi:hypothetical protein
MAGSRNYGSRQCVFFERAPGGGAPHSATPTDACMRGDGSRFFWRAARKQSNNYCCHRCGEIAILLSKP